MVPNRSSVDLNELAINRASVKRMANVCDGYAESLSSTPTLKYEDRSLFERELIMSLVSLELPLLLTKMV